MKGAVQHDIWKVLFDVENEFHAARDKHGAQTEIPDFGYAEDRHIYYGIPTADTARVACERHFQIGYPSWGDILVEEVAEAIEAENEQHLYEELVQVAQVATAWALAIKQRVAGSPPAVEASERAAGERTTTT